MGCVSKKFLSKKHILDKWTGQEMITLLITTWVSLFLIQVSRSVETDL